MSPLRPVSPTIRLADETTGPVYLSGDVKTETLARYLKKVEELVIEMAEGLVAGALFFYSCSAPMRTATDSAFQGPREFSED